ncbi:MAG: hypothetical protein LC740_05705 [Actinobacteria bacterium]|nr:hypothetical protein [Actinomycetota bacterium]
MTVLHMLHVLLAGVWLGGVVFTMAVVSPVLDAMKWQEPERVRTRSAIGKQYARVGSANLVLLLVFALLDGWATGFGAFFYVEYALLAVVFGLVVAHGAYFGWRLAALAGEEQRAESPAKAAAFASHRRALQRASSKVSWADLAASTVVLLLAVNG